MQMFRALLKKFLALKILLDEIKDEHEGDQEKDENDDIKKTMIYIFMKKMKK